MVLIEISKLPQGNCVGAKIDETCNWFRERCQFFSLKKRLAREDCYIQAASPSQLSDIRQVPRPNLDELISPELCNYISLKAIKDKTATNQSIFIEVSSPFHLGQKAQLFLSFKDYSDTHNNPNAVGEILNRPPLPQKIHLLKFQDNIGKHYWPIIISTTK